MGALIKRSDKPARRRLPRRNLMTFPRELRDAIPDLPTYVGRSLELDAIQGLASHTRMFGQRVHLHLVVKETGKLKGQFTVLVDLEVEAARGLAKTIADLADKAEKMTPGGFQL